MNDLMTGRGVARNAGLLAFAALGVIAFGGVFRSLLTFSLKSEVYTYIPLIPLVSLYLIYSQRASILAVSDYSPRAGLVLVGGSLLLYIAGKALLGQSDQQDYLSVMVLSAVLFGLGGFVLFWGGAAFSSARFPLLFLLLMVPLPNLLLEKVIQLLQAGSTAAAQGVFMLVGVPFVREDFVFRLPGLSVEVAEQCSGIRSGLALLITGLLASHLFLKRFRNQVILMLAVLPIAVFKNGLRVVTLTLLGTYWDKRILDSDLHRKGGVPFFALSMLMMGLVLWGLSKIEKRSQRGD